MQNEIINTCFLASQLTQGSIRTIASYSHVIPVILSLLFALFVLIKARSNFFSRVFFIFIFVFSLWLMGDLIAWTSNNYNLVYTTWSFLVYVEIIFYILGLYFIIVFVKKGDLSIFYKLILFLISLPPLIFTVMGYSVLGFNQPICEAANNNFLDVYKLVIEAIILFVILFYMAVPFFKKENWKIKKTNSIMLGSMFLFLSIFGVTEYISAITGIYEYNLYSLFLLPIFLLVIIYAVFELDIFRFNIIGTQYLVVGLVILIVGQVFFVESTTDILLTILTIISSVALSIILFRNLKRESDQRLQIEDLSFQLNNYNKKLAEANEKLKGLDKLKSEFVSLASHQLRSPLTAIKGYTSMLIEGDYGEINPKAKEIIDRVLESSSNLTLVVEDLLNITKIEQGGMKYEMAKFDFGDLVENTVKDLSVTAEAKGLKLINNVSIDQKYFVNGDKEKLRQVLINLIDNSMKYTPSGQIEACLERKDTKIVLSIKDTGVGIAKEAIGKLFEKFAREDKAELNVSGSGLGLYLVKEIIEAHHGRVWVESEGTGKGSTFFVELEEIK